MIQELQEFGTQVEVYDPWADAKEVEREYNLPLIEDVNMNDYEAVILAVSHDKFKALDFTTTEKQVLFDIKSFIQSDNVDGRL